MDNKLTKDLILTKAHAFAAEEDTVEIVEETQDRIIYLVESGADVYERMYRFSEQINKKLVKDMMLADNKVRECMDISRLSKFIAEEIDINALIVCDRIALIWDDNEGHSDVRDELELIHSDEYAQYVAEDMCGTTWVERQVVVINVREIAAVCDAMNLTCDDFARGVISTLLHEFRHLLYECNEMIEFGEEYPADGGGEDEVEWYGNCMAEQTAGRYEDIFLKMPN